MDLIIQAILRIFEAAFEKDASRRKGQQEQEGRARQAPSVPPAKKPRRSLEEWLAQNLQELEAEMKPRPPGASPAAKPPVIPAQKREYREQPQAAEASMSKPIAAMKVRPLSELQADRQIKRDSRSSSGTKGFDLPGKSALERMVIAQTILGPCHAQRDSAENPGI